MTNQLSVARSILTLVLFATATSAFVLDWSPNHLLNPLWHPHAKFHGALLLFFLAGCCLTALGAMWTQPSPEAIRIAGLLSLSFWTPLFYITTVIPESTSWAGAAANDPRLSGSLVTPNLLVATGAVLATLSALALTVRKSQPHS